jgi:hypothetical protein
MNACSIIVEVTHGDMVFPTRGESCSAPRGTSHQLYDCVLVFLLLFGVDRDHARHRAFTVVSVFTSSPLSYWFCALSYSS